MKFIADFSCLVVLFAVFCIEQVKAASSGSQWTYRTTPTTCKGTYTDPCGQNAWSNIAPTCGSGTKQTPIDISNVLVRSNLSQPAVTAVNGGCTTWVQFSNNYTFEVAFQDTGYVCNNLQLSYGGKSYTMQQIHFHTPSEHTIGGGYFSGEAHMVHKSSDGSLLVLGVFLQVAGNNLQDSNNTFFENLWHYGEHDTFTGEEAKISSAPAMNPYNGLLPGRFSNYRYTGSLTTPPCTEGVQWFVFDQPIQISQYDLKTLRKAATAFKSTTVSEYGNTNRETQPLNGRTVVYTSGAPPTTSSSNGDTTATTTVYVSDDDATDRRIRRLSIAAIVLASFSTILALALAIWVGVIQSKVA